MGDGSTMYGADEGNAHVGSFKSFFEHNAQGYNGSIQAEIGNVMASYSAINWLPMAISPLLSTVLRNTLKFDGFVISDYMEIDKLIDQQLPTDFQKFEEVDEAIATTMNAGVDMMMIPSKGDFQDYIEGVKSALNNHTLPMDRLNDAVARIISVKLALGVAKLQQPEDSHIRFRPE